MTIKDWDFRLGSEGGDLPTSMPVGLKNVYLNKFLKYKERDYGINMSWDTNNLQNITILSQSGGASVMFNEPIALRVEDGGKWLKYKEREYGINLGWSDTPVFEWKIESDGRSGAVHIREQVALVNTVIDQELIYCERAYGINLAWLKDCDASSRRRYSSGSWLQDTWNGVKGVASALWATLSDLFNRALGLWDSFLTLFGVMVPKKIRILVVILRDENGRAVMADESLPDSVRAQDMVRINAAIQFLKDVFEDQVNTSVHAANSQMILTIDHSAPQEALDLTGDYGEVLGDDLSTAGAFFREHMAKSWRRWALGYGSPVTVFIVRAITGKAGYSLGFISDYVVADVDGFDYDPDPFSGIRSVAASPKGPSTLAHEVGHACGLWHPIGGGVAGTPNNLMLPDRETRGRNLEIHQRILVRGSRHVTIF